MFVSEQHKFIFIHVPRTGGTSISEEMANLATRYNAHTTYSAAKGKLEELDFSKYFTFGFIRNPWERVHSLFCKQVNRKSLKFKGYAGLRAEETYKSKDFKYWMFSELHRKRHTRQRHKQSAMYFLKGVDYIARYENFDEEWNYIFDKIGLPRVEVPHINKSNKFRSYKKSYDSEMKNFMTQYHQDDIDYGSYTF